MRPFVGLVRKELHAYGASPTFYFVGAAFLAYTGYYFHTDLVYFITFGFGINIMENLWQLVFMDMRLVLLLAIPLLTMRSFAEERRLGTLELLLTYPVTDAAVVGAKMLSCFWVVGLLVGGTLTYPWLLYAVQPFDWTPLVAAYVGVLLFAAACVAFGVFVSSWTDSQVLAGFLTAVPLLMLWLLSWNEAASPADRLPLLRAVSLFSHYQPFTVGVIDARDVFYFVWIVGLCFWGTLQVLEARQWRGRR